MPIVHPKMAALVKAASEVATTVLGQKRCSVSVIPLFPDRGQNPRDVALRLGPR